LQPEENVLREEASRKPSTGSGRRFAFAVSVRLSSNPVLISLRSQYGPLSVIRNVSLTLTVEINILTIDHCNSLEGKLIENHNTIVIMAQTNSSPNSLITRFKFQKLLNQDQGGRRAVLQGTIGGEPALLLAERAAFSNDERYLSSFSRLVTHVNNLGANDIYHWYMANSLPDGTLDQPTPPDLKINLIYPCKDSHIRKYSFQQARVVLETPEIYAKYVQPYMQHYREEGKLNWVFNILEGRKEQENVLYRSKEVESKDDFLLLPDLNWDRTTIGGLHLLALVERRDIWSVRDLKKKDVSWLRHLRSTLTKAVEGLYEGVENDMLKFYVHCVSIEITYHSRIYTNRRLQINQHTTTSTSTSFTSI
jgi:m7GpppX diphosphatase